MDREMCMLRIPVITVSRDLPQTADIRANGVQMVTGPSQFVVPYGIAVNSTGFVFVADTYNARTQVFSNDGTYVSQWGSLGNNNGQFYLPGGVAVDGTGNVYVTDYYLNRIQKFSPSMPALPTAGFTINTTSGTAPLTVMFTDNSTGTSITSWNWSFGDGTWENITSSTNPIHTYTFGTWYPTLTVTNVSGSNMSVITPARTITVTSGDRDCIIQDWHLQRRQLVY